MQNVHHTPDLQEVAHYSEALPLAKVCKRSNLVKCVEHFITQNITTLDGRNTVETRYKLQKPHFVTVELFNMDTFLKYIHRHLNSTRGSYLTCRLVIRNLLLERGHLYSIL